MSAKDLDLLHAARTEDLEDSQISQLAVLGEYEKEVVSRITFTMQHKQAMKAGMNMFTDLLSQLSILDNKPRKKKSK